MKNEILKTATMCSGIGAPEVALNNLGVKHRVVFAAEKDKYARITYEANHTAETFYGDMTAVDWTGIEPIDLVIAGLPCQAFSNAGKKGGEDDARGTLFYNFYEFVKLNGPKAFILENVPGMLNVKGVNILQKWLDLLADSVNGQSAMFKNPACLNYTCFWTILNTTDYGLPQNRERVFIVGFKTPCAFRFPKGFPLTKRLKDILQVDVPEKYYLSDKMLNYLLSRKDNYNNGKINYKGDSDIASTLQASSGLDISDNIIVTNQDGELSVNAVDNCIDANYHKGMDNHSQRSFILGYTRDSKGEVVARHERDTAQTIHSVTGSGGNTDQFVVHNMSPRTGDPNKGGTGHLSLTDGIAYCLQTSDVNRVELLVEPQIINTNWSGVDFINDYAGTLRANASHNYQKVLETNTRIRRLTERECFRLQGFPDSFDISGVSATQAYKQAGNTMSVPVIEGVIKNTLEAIELIR